MPINKDFPRIKGTFLSQKGYKITKNGDKSIANGNFLSQGDLFIVNFTLDFHIVFHIKDRHNIPFVRL